MRINSLFFRFVMVGLCLMLFTNISSAQKATIKGIITDAVNGEAIPATIKISNMDGSVAGGAIADLITGEYSVTVNPGKYKVYISYMSMKPIEQEVELAAGDAKEINAEMSEEVDLMKTVTVTSSKAGTELARTTVSIDILKPTLVENTNATKVDDVIGKVPGVQVIDGQANIRGGSGYSFGAGSRVLILVDDLPFMQADAGYASWRDIPVESIDQIEVLKGAASALYGSSALNGIINIRTAYAKSKPVTKFAFFQTSFAAPRDRMVPSLNFRDTLEDGSRRMVPVTGLAWWKDSVRVGQSDIGATGDNDTTFLPGFLSGPNGYRKPIEFGMSVSHRQKFGKFDLTIGGNGFWKESYLAGEYERKLRGNANMRYRITDSLHVGVNVNFNYGKSASFFLWNNGNSFATKYADSLSFMTFPGSITTSDIFRFNVDPFVTLYDTYGNRHRLQTRIYYVNNANANNQSNKSTLYYGEYQYQRDFEKLDNLKMVAGTVGQYSTVIAQLYGNASYTIVNAAAYVQLDKGFIKRDNGQNRLNISVGGRFEYNNILSPDSIQITANPNLIATGDHLIKNPEPRSRQARPVFRAGVNFEATPVTFIRASWGQGYRYPTIAERYITTLVGDPNGSTALEIRANPTLQAETGWSTEIGIKQGFMITRNWKGFVDVSVFWTEYQNMMEFTFGGGDSAAISGITLAAVNSGTPIFFQSANVGDTRMNILAGYTYLDPQFKDFNSIQQLLSSEPDRNILKYRNQHTAKFDIEAFFLKKNNLSVGFYMNYTSRMVAIDAAFQNLILGDEQTLAILGPVDAFGIGRYRSVVNDGENINLGARIGYRYAFMDADGKKEKFGMKLSLVGNNLLNQEYSIRPGLVGAPTNITARLDIEF